MQLEIYLLVLLGYFYAVPGQNHSLFLFHTLKCRGKHFKVLYMNAFTELHIGITACTFFNTCCFINELPADNLLRKKIMHSCLNWGSQIVSKSGKHIGLILI